VQAKAPEEATVACAVAIVGGLGERRALDGLAAASALHGGRVDEQKVVFEARALAGEDTHQPLDRLGQTPAALEVTGLGGQRGEQVAKSLGGDRQEAPVRRYAHDRLRDAQRHDLRVCDASLGVLHPVGQEIVGRDVNGSEQQVEVGVHRGPLRSAMPDSTADFDPAAQKPSVTTGSAVESII
jgi:hypothetical protein